MKKRMAVSIGFIFGLNMNVLAGSLDVTVALSSANFYASLATQNKITLGNSVPACTPLGGYIKNVLRQNSVNSNGSSLTYYLSMINYIVIAEEVCIGQQANYKIYKTDIPGIGISYNDADSGSQSYGKSLPLWPQVIPKLTASGAALGVGLSLDIRLWKYSSAANSLPAGILYIKGPTIAQGVGPVAGDTMASCSSEVASAATTDFCYIDRATPLYLSSVYSSTCEFVNASKTVRMGKHVMPLGTPEGKGTPWVDASFQLRCSDAWGYSSDATNPNNLTQNNTVTVTVQPRDGFIDATNGIIKLDGTGAEGVGIQLAWGDYSSLGTVPLKPVKLNTPTNANTLSSHFAAGPYSIGGNAVSGDGSIKMAARYIRTGGTLKPGLANAKVEIMANYQ